MEKIDFVVTWVDGDDPEWLRKKQKYNPTEAKLNTDIRFRDYGTFKYWFRAVEKYAPWVNKIYIVTEGHLPEWLNIANKKLVTVKHSDFMPNKYLPTFNSNAIELNLHRIKDLSEHFVLFNDDMFLMNMTKSTDFFKEGLPKDFGVYSPTVPYKEFSNIIFNNIRVVNNNFSKYEDVKRNLFKFFNYKYGTQNLRSAMTMPWSKILGYWNPHLTSSFLKSTFFEVWAKEDVLDKTSMNKFRTSEDVNQWLFRYFQIEKGKFVPQSATFGKYCTLNNFKEIESSFKNSKLKELCINDDFNVENYEKKMDILNKMFEKKFPNKSKFEI
ncbi:stealth family protein [Pediococcus pentosaceus]|uniref:stealth family protein n=1 Tax=Pediococcus pentosaceus TaxID=1255 RepID=UPI00294FC643|nr:stealth family protein [Pediococcus pentosaceus]MDV6379949.1 stealth family protein [Pediococcus pentosaceus]